jgi:hypothetical protein
MIYTLNFENKNREIYLWCLQLIDRKVIPQAEIMLVRFANFGGREATRRSLAN